MTRFHKSLFCSLACMVLAQVTTTAYAASTANGHTITKRNSVPISFLRSGEQFSSMATIDFWQTNDLGTSWNKVKSIRVPEDNTGFKPGYVFRAPADGTYGFRTCVSYHSGKADRQPKPGDRPLKSDILVVDTTKPVVAKFSQSFPNPGQPRTTVTLEWAIRDLHPGTTPTFIEWRDTANVWHPLGARRAVYGSITITPPSDAVMLRCSAKDLAGNVSETSLLALPPIPTATPIPAANTNPKPAAETKPQGALVAKPTAKPATGPVAKAEKPTNNKNTQQQAQNGNKPSEKPVATGTKAPAFNLPSRKELEAQRNGESTTTSGQAATNPAKVRAPRPAAVVPEGHNDVVEPWKERGPRFPDAQQAAIPQPIIESKPAETNSSSPAKPAPRAEANRTPQPVVIPQPIDQQKTLVRARNEAADGNYAAAARFYKLLRGGELAALALAEEIEVLRRLQRYDEALTLFKVAAPAIIGSSTHIAVADIYVDLKRWNDAEQALNRVATTSTNYRQARYLRALVWMENGQRGEGRAEMRILALSDDRWGRAAQRWLDSRR